MIKDCPLCDIVIIGMDEQDRDRLYWEHIVAAHPAELYRAIRQGFEVAHARRMRIDIGVKH